MSHSNGPTRRHVLRAGAVLGGASLAGRTAWAQAKAQPTKVLDFQTYADMAKVEQEGQFVFYCHENEAGTAAIVDAFTKDFPKIKGSYVRAQTGALYSKMLAERSASRYDVDVIQLSDLAPAIDFQKKGGYNIYHSPEASAYQAEYLSDPPGAYFWTGVDFSGICYNKSRVPDADAPKNWKDLLNPRWKGVISCKIAASGLQFVEWYELRKLYGDDYWTSFAKLNPHAFDSRVQLMDRLAHGDDKVTAVGEYAAYVLYQKKGADIAFVAPPDGLPATPLVVGAVSNAPHPETAKLFVDWAMSLRGQKFYQDNMDLIYASVRDDAPPMVTGMRLRDFKILAPTDMNDYLGAHDQFLKVWGGMLGL
jgi:iron(III) transport system substrate-binding protein